MTLGFFHPEIEQSAMAQAAARDRARDLARLGATSEISSSVSAIAARGKLLTPQVALALAKSNASKAAIDYANLQATKLVMTTPEDPGNFFERNIFNPFKKAIRYATAAFETTPEIVQNIASGGGVGFSSTTLGTMLDNPEIAGEGYLPSEETRKLAGERARRLRGTTKGGNAFTVGRAAADVFFTPSSVAHNLVSGFLDAAVNIVADPTNIALAGVGKISKAAAQIPDAAKALETIAKLDSSLDEAIALGTRTAEEVKAIRLNEVNQIWDASAFGSWFDGNWRARALNRRVEKVANGFRKRIDKEVANAGGKASEELLGRLDTARAAAAHYINDRLFKGRIREDQLARVLPSLGVGPNEELVITNGERFKNIFGESAVRLGDNGANLMPTDVRKLPGANRLRFVAEDSSGAFRVSRFRNYFQPAAESTMLVRGNQQDRFKAVKNIANLMKSLRTVSPERREQVIGMAAKAYGSMSRGNPTEIKATMDVVREVVIDALKEAGASDGVIRKVMSEHERRLGRLRTSIATVLGEQNGHAYVRGLSAMGILDEQQILNDLSKAGKTITSLDDMDLAAHSAMITSELLNQTQFLPDPRVLKRLTKNPFWQRTVQRAYVTKEGDLRMIAQAAEVFQNDIWKPLALMQPAYVLRNVLDGQFHVFVSADYGLKGLFRNPSAFFNYVIGNPNAKFAKGIRRRMTRGAGGIAGEEFFDGMAAALGVERTGIDATEAWSRSMQANSVHVTGDAADVVRRASPNFVRVARSDNPEAHTLGLLDQLRMVWTAPEVQMAMRRSRAVIGATPPTGNRTFVPKLMEVLNEPRHAELREQMLYLASGFSYGNDATKVPVRIAASRFRSLAPDARRIEENAILEQYLSSQIGGYVDKWSRIPEMWAMAGFNRIPIVADDEVRAVVASINFSDAKKLAKEGGVLSTVDDSIGVGTIIDGPKSANYVDAPRIGPAGAPSEPGAFEYDWLVTNAIRDDAGKVVRLEAIPVYKPEAAPLRRGEFYEAFKTRTGGRDIRGEDYSNVAINVVNKLANNLDQGGAGLVADGTLPAVSGYMVRLDAAEPGYNQLLNRWKDFTDTVFGTWIGKTMDFVEKSPLFRQSYYRYVSENADLLSPDQHAQLLANISSFAKKLNIEEWKYVGDKKLYAAIRNAKATGNGTVEQLSQFAGNAAHMDLKELLFDHAQKSNIEDALRVMAPFAGAWREVLTKYARQLSRNPAAARKIERGFVGLTKADLQSDGNGFFEKDPQTGKYMFNLPLSDFLSKATTGLYAPLVAQVQGLSMGLALVPSLGPVAQIPADIILRGVPKENDIRKFLLPYGSEGVKAFAPGWARKALEAINANPEVLDSMYGQMYVETVRALGASGAYELNDPSDREQMFQDAHGKARILTAMRALSQFVGPAAGTVKFEIDTKQGDVYIQHLIKAFQDMQEEDYDTAVPNFLEAFGDQAMLYVSGKSKSEVGGLLPQEQFDRWADSNSALMSRFKDVAGFMAPGGDEFSFLVWKRQIERGQRTRLSAREIVDQAENMVGASLFRAKRLKYGPFPSQDQRAYLRLYRAALHEKYPGFPPVADFNTGEFDTFMSGLRQVVDDASMKDNQAAIATRFYLRKREQVLAQAQAAGLVTIRSKAATPLRDYLATVGEALVQKYPDFERVFEQKLQAELMQYEDN